VDVTRSYLIDTLDGPEYAKIPFGSRVKSLPQGACEITFNYSRMKKNFILVLSFTFFFCLGSLYIANSVVGQEEDVQADPVDLGEANVFEDYVNKTSENDSQENASQEIESDESKDDSVQGKVQKASDSVELNGDVVEYSMDGNKVIATGNVVVITKDMTLTCDQIEFSRDTNLAYATGNVRLVMKKGGASEMSGEKLTFNFKTMEGSFDGAKIYADPYYGYGGKVSKVGENQMRMEDNYITTCDLDKPHYRLTSKKMDIYPGDKLVARAFP